MSLKSVKTKIKSIDKTRQVTKAMEAVSAVKMRKSQANALSTRPYARAALKILRSVSGATEAKAHPLMTARPVARTCVIVVSADKGLAGSYGSSLLKQTYRFFAERSLNEKNTALITIGKKAHEHFLKRGWTILAHHEHWSDHVDFSSIEPLASELKDLFLTGAYDEVFIVYTNFISTLKQTVYTHQLLPVSFDRVEEVIRGIAPEKGKFSDLRQDMEHLPVREYSFEPSPETILAQLIPALFNIQIYHSVLEANASEHSARMIAMKNASDSAGDISRALKLRFNKVRQSAITKEVSEIVGGMESMKITD